MKADDVVKNLASIAHDASPWAGSICNEAIKLIERLRLDVAKLQGAVLRSKMDLHEALLHTTKDDS